MRHGKAWVTGVVLLANYITDAPVAAHEWTRADVVRALNEGEVRARAGVRSARIDPALARHLIVEVEPAWGELPADVRIALASRWFSVWRRAAKLGIVSIVDSDSGRTVVNYLGDGGIVLLSPLAEDDRVRPRTSTGAYHEISMAPDEEPVRALPRLLPLPLKRGR